MFAVGAAYKKMFASENSPLNFFSLSLIERSLKAVISQKKVQEIPLSCVQNTNN